MAIFTSVPTVAFGDPWSASQQNTFLRDNLDAMRPDTGIAFKSASQSIPNDTETAWIFSAPDEVDDTAGFFDFAAQATRLTIPYNGVFLVTFSVAFDFHATGYRTLRAERNASGNDDGN